MGSTIQFTTERSSKRYLVAVLDLAVDRENPVLTSAQRKAFSEIFRSLIIKSGNFQVASSADVDRFDPDAIQEVGQCTRDECATIIGQQLGVDRVISSSVFPISKGKLLLSAKMINIQDSSILKSETVTHVGAVSDLERSLKKLAIKLGATYFTHTNIDALLAKQAKIRAAELAKIAQEKDKLKKAQLKNQAEWKEIARQAEINRLKWQPIDQSLSLGRAIQEADALRKEFRSLVTRFDQQKKQSIKNIQAASTIEKDPFETKTEYKTRKEAVQGAQNKRMADLQARLSSQRAEVLLPLIQRLQTLQKQRFTLPSMRLTVQLQAPDPEHSGFPLWITKGQQRWKLFWKYQDRKVARKIWATKSLLEAQALVGVAAAGKQTKAVLASVEVLHAGLGIKRRLELRALEEFPEVKSEKQKRRAAVVAVAARWKRAPLSQGYKILPALVYDTKTTLMWQRGSSPSGLVWLKAKSYCRNLRLGGYRDWSWPSKKQLATLLTKQKNRQGRYINQKAFPKTAGFYGSSTVYVAGSTYAWYVNFYNGSISSSFKTSSNYVRCVR